MRVLSSIANTVSRVVIHKGGKTPRDTAWADGLRGVAAAGVVSSHVVLAFWTQYVRPCEDGIGGPSLLFQRPIFRLIVQGQAMVAIFFILMGFVNPLRALKQASFDDVEGALQTLAKSGISRITRLVLPAAVVTVISWFMCQLGMFTMAKWSGAFWLASNSPLPSGEFCAAFGDLFLALKNTWANGSNIYDQPQWALEYLLKGSMYILLILLITISASPKFRILVYVGFWCISWAKGEALVGHNIAPGMLLAELQNLSVQPVSSLFGRLLTFITAFLGLFLMSYPSEYQTHTKWSQFLLILGTGIYPEGADLGRFWTGLGAQIFCFSIFFNQHLRSFFSIPIFTYLGGISFSIYLLHGTIMRSLLTYLAFAPQDWSGMEYVDDHIPRPGPFHLFISLVIFAMVTIGASQLWTSKVDPIFGKLTVALQQWASSYGTGGILTPRNGSPARSLRGMSPTGTKERGGSHEGLRLD